MLYLAEGLFGVVCAAVMWQAMWSHWPLVIATLQHFASLGGH